MSCCCQFIPTYIEDRVIAKTQNVSPRTSEISSSLRSHRREMKTIRELVESGPSASRTKNLVYTAKNRQILPGTTVACNMVEATSSKDADVVSAWTLSDYFVRFCHDVLKRNSFDRTMKSTVHYYIKYNNAFFNGSQIIYGDGDKIVFEDFAQDPSVVFHELWHAVTDRTCGLDYNDQSGALAESLSDVFASIIMQWMHGESVDEASWLIGERCLISIDGNSYALRSLADPGTAFVDHPYLGTDDQPQDMNHYSGSSEDNNGVHRNSGIPNHAFYLFAKAVGGDSWDIPCKIWYGAITTAGLVSPGATFAEFAQATITTASDLYGSSTPDIIDKLRTAWQKTKVL